MTRLMLILALLSLLALTLASNTALAFRESPAVLAVSESESEYRAVASLRYTLDDGTGHRRERTCNGVFVRIGWILSAAECFASAPDYRRELTIHVRTSQMSGRFDAKLHVEPSYCDETACGRGLDIALLELDRSRSDVYRQQSEYAIMDDASVLPRQYDSTARIVSWEGEDTLRQAWPCYLSDDRNVIPLATGSECALRDVGARPNREDLGAGLYFLIGGQRILYGIVSRVTASGRRTEATSTWRVTPWIRETIDGAPEFVPSVSGDPQPLTLTLLLERIESLEEQVRVLQVQNDNLAVAVSAPSELSRDSFVRIKVLEAQVSNHGESITAQRQRIEALEDSR